MPVLALPLLTVAVALAMAASGHWRIGSHLIGIAVLLAAGLRLVLPEQALGGLAVRGRTVDGAMLLVLGGGLVALAHSVPYAS